jgi:hypothetical protein
MPCSGMLGHASANMTLDVYAGLFGDDLDSVACLLDEAARRAAADGCGLSADQGGHRTGTAVRLGRGTTP